MAFIELQMPRARRRRSSAGCCGGTTSRSGSAFVSVVAFVRLHLRAGRAWLGWTAIGLRTVALVINFFSTPNINYSELTAPASMSRCWARAWRWPRARPTRCWPIAQFGAGRADRVRRRCRGDGVAQRRAAPRADDRRQPGLLRVGRLRVRRPLVLGAGADPGARQPVLPADRAVHGLRTEPGPDPFGAAGGGTRGQDGRACRDPSRSSHSPPRRRSAGLWSVDRATGRLWATPQALSMFGLKPDREHHVDELLAPVHPDDRDRVREFIGGAHGDRSRRHGRVPGGRCRRAKRAGTARAARRTRTAARLADADGSDDRHHRAQARRGRDRAAARRAGAPCRASRR